MKTIVKAHRRKGKKVRRHRRKIKKCIRLAKFGRNEPELAFGKVTKFPPSELEGVEDEDIPGVTLFGRRKKKEVEIKKPSKRELSNKVDILEEELEELTDTIPDEINQEDFIEQLSDKEEELLDTQKELEDRL